MFENLKRSLIGERRVEPVDAEIMARGGKFVAITADGRMMRAQIDEYVGNTSMQYFDGIFGILMGRRVLFAPYMD